MDNICIQAAKRIRGLALTANLQPNASDETLVNALEENAWKIDALVQTEEPNTASDALLEARALVTNDRRVSHGDMIDGFGRIARLWSALLADRDLEADPLEPSEVCDMMELLKVARRQSGDFNSDDYIDGAGYAACGFECRKQEAWSAATATNEPGIAEVHHD